MRALLRFELPSGRWLPCCKAAATAGLSVWFASATAADVRDRTRPVDLPNPGVTQSQASDITLTPTEAALRPIQTWIRSAGALDRSAKTVTALVSASDAQKIRVGQRVRSFPVNARTRMHQGRITALTSQAHGALVVATLAGDFEAGSAASTDAGSAARYLLEIVTEQGPYLSIPNVSIIDDGLERVVYLQRSGGEYLRRVIRTGLEGELYTQVLEGLSDGDLVISIGSFFVDAEQKLSAAGAAAMFGICSTTPGLEYSAVGASGLGRKSRLLGNQQQISKFFDRAK